MLRPRHRPRKRNQWTNDEIFVPTTERLLKMSRVRRAAKHCFSFSTLTYFPLDARGELESGTAKASHRLANVLKSADALFPHGSLYFPFQHCARDFANLLTLPVVRAPREAAMDVELLKHASEIGMKQAASLGSGTQTFDAGTVLATLKDIFDGPVLFISPLRVTNAFPDSFPSFFRLQTLRNGSALLFLGRPPAPPFCTALSTQKSRKRRESRS